MPAGALIGSAVIGAGASIYGADQAKGAAKDAQAAQLAAQAQARGDAVNAQGVVTGLQTPYAQGGSAAFNALLAQYGLAPAAPAPMSGADQNAAWQANYNANNLGMPGSAAGPALTPAPGQAYGAAPPAAPPQQDWTGYVESQPDLKTAYNDPGIAAWWADKGGEAAWGQAQYASTGQSEGRAVPTVAAPQQAANPFAPQAWSPPSASSYGPQPTAPTMQSVGGGPSLSNVPGAPDLSAAAFQQSPLYNLGLKTGQDNLNANFGARGLLRSGAAVKGAIDFARDNINQNYTSFANTALNANAQAQAGALGNNQGALSANQQTQYGANANNTNALNLYTQQANQYNNNRNFDYGNYTDGLGYNTGQYNTNTNNLFNLANIGTGAAANIGNAATNVANTTGNLALQGGQANANYANSVGSANSQLGGSLAGIGQNLFTNLGNAGIGNRTTPLTPVSPYGYGNSQLQAVSPFNPGTLTQPWNSAPVF